MVKIDWAKINGGRAALYLSEGDPSLAIRILESELEISHDLRIMLASMLSGFGPNNTKLVVKGAGGEIQKTRKNLDRDYELYLSVERETSNSGCSIEEACELLSGQAMLGDDAIRKAYQRINKSIQDYNSLSHEMRESRIEKPQR